LADLARPAKPGITATAAHAQLLLGDIATHPDQFDAESGEAHYRQALALAEPRGMRPLVAHSTSASASSTGAPASGRRRRNTSP
jgi:hypothetical protein